MLDEKLLVFVLGAPGAGKGTQCDLIVKEYGWVHFSAGDLLRAQVKAGTEMGKQAEEYIKAGTMVPASMIIGLLKQAVTETQHAKVLIDGFPRVLDQLKDFEQSVRPCDTALFYNVPQEAAKERLLKRGQTSGRVDDNEETIQNRFIVFKQESMPVITELEKEGRAVEIDAAQSPEQVFEATRKVIEQLEQKQASRAQQQLEAAATADAAPAAAADAVPAAAVDMQAVASPATSAVQSPKASITPAAVSPVPAAATAAAEGASAPVSPQATAAAAADDDAAVANPAATQAAATELLPAAAGAAGSAAGSAASSPTKFAVGSPVAAAGAADGAADAADTAGVPALAALAAAAAGTAAAAASGSTAQAEALQPAAAAAAAGSPEKAVPTIVVPAAVPAAVAGVPAHLDVTSPTAAAPSPRATLASLHVDLSGIRTPIVICGPSGVGKGTLINKLMEQHPEHFGFSVSHTTRGPRPGEVHGKHYYFTEKEAMAAQVAAGMFLEHADVHGNMYGTSLAAVAQVSAAGKHTVLDIDVQGAAQVRKSALGPHCLFIFVAPPSHEELERRLRNRGTETEDKVLQRLANAESEIAKAQEPGLFHHVLVNADLEVAYQELQKLIEKRVPGLLQPAAAAAGGSSSSSKRTSEAGSAVASTPTGAAAVAAATSPNASVPAVSAVSPVAAAAGLTGVAAAAAAAATAALSPRQHQQHQQQPHVQPALANGNASSAVGGTSTLLDFGFGASAGPAVAAKGMPVRQYMDATVIPVLRDGLKALNAARPDDPLQFLADYLVSHKAAVA